MAKILLSFTIFASTLAGHWEEWHIFKKDSVGKNNENRFPMEMKELCSSQNVFFSLEEALTNMIKTINLKIGNETKNIPIMVSEDGTNYLIFQRRLNGEVDFDTIWNDYVDGFGNPEGEYWIGLKALNKLTSAGKFVLTIFLESFNNRHVFARYDTFRVDGPETNYKLTVGGYSGTAGDAMEYQNNMMFTTKDKDNDNFDENCAVKFKGAWWHNACHLSNLNGIYYAAPGYHNNFADGINWKPFMGYYDSMKKSIMALSLK